MSNTYVIVDRCNGKGLFSLDHVSGGGLTDRRPIDQLDIGTG